MNLDCCEVTTITGDYDMVIITLDNLSSMLSCLPTPRDAMSMLCGRHADSRSIGTLLGPCLIQEWASRCFGPKFFSGLKVCVHLPCGEPVSQRRPEPDLPLGLGAWRFLSIVLRRAVT
jgi:hypothetical protein